MYLICVLFWGFSHQLLPSGQFVGTQFLLPMLIDSASSPDSPFARIFWGEGTRGSDITVMSYLCSHPKIVQSQCNLPWPAALLPLPSFPALAGVVHGGFPPTSQLISARWDAATLNLSQSWEASHLLARNRRAVARLIATRVGGRCVGKCRAFLGKGYTLICTPMTTGLSPDMDA